MSARLIKAQSAYSTHVPTLLAEARRKAYSGDLNLDDVVDLSIAENSLLQGWLIEQLGKNFNLEARHLNYQPPGGSNSLKEAICITLNQYFNPAIPVRPEDLICGAGVVAILAQLIYAICDEDDGVLISKPYYSGYDHVIKQGVHLIDFEIQNPLNPRSVSDALEKAYQLGKHSHVIKAVLLCNPHNPLGYSISKETLYTYAKFCQAHGLHLIVDEIYGLSDFKGEENDGTADPPQSSKFISTLSLSPTESDFDPTRVHVLYGISKDFGCAGLRAGVLISQNNPTLINSISNLNLNQIQISSLTDLCFSNLVLSDHSRVLKYYLDENKTRLREAYEYATSRLRSLGIKHEHSNAGFCIMIDLSRYLPKLCEPDQIKEESCFLKLLNEHKLLIAPGMLYHYPKPGFFRLTFTVPRDQLNLGLERLTDFVHSFDLKDTKRLEHLNLVKSDQ